MKICKTHGRPVRWRFMIVVQATIIILSISLPAQTKTATLGGIRFEEPEGWKHEASAGNHSWQPEGGGVVNSRFFWAGPLKDAGGVLEDQFKVLLARTQAEFYVLKSKAFTLQLKSGLENRGTTGSIKQKKGGAVLLTVHILLRGKDGLYYFTYCAGDSGTFTGFMKNEFNSMFDSLKVVETSGGNTPPAEDESFATSEETTINPGELPAGMGTIERFCFTLQVPAGWKEDQRSGDLPSYMMLYDAPAGLPGKNDYLFPVMIQSVIGLPADPGLALGDWIKTAFMPNVCDPEEGSRSEFKPVIARRWRFASGDRGATARLDHYLNGRFEGHYVAHIYSTGGVTFFMGARLDFKGVARDRQEVVIEAYRKLLALLKNIAAHARVSLPGRIAKWEDHLVNRRSYAYFYESNYGGPSGFWLVITREVCWDFFPDRTCKSRSKGYTGMSSTYHDDFYNPTRITGFASGAAEHDNKTDRSRFEVRGTGDGDLWIVVYRANGMGTFHRMEPGRTGAFGVSKPCGLCIDGRIEGNYSKGDGYMFWELKK